MGVVNGLRWAVDQNLAFVIGDARDHVGLNPHAAVGKHRVTRGHLHGRDRACAQSHGEVRGVFFFIEAKFGNPFLRIACANCLQNSDRNHVL